MRYRLDRLGFVVEVVIVLGPKAGKVHLPSHAAVARKLLKFTGVIGKARTLLEWARALVTGRRDRVPGKRAFEARAELEKLPAQLADYLDQKRNAELFTDPAATQAFQERLRAFRGNDNPHPPSAFRGGEGQLFHSDVTPRRALKRWFTDRITDKPDSPGKPTSVRLLRDVAKLVDANPELAKHLEVVRVHEEGPDWIVRDFDGGSVEVSGVEGPHSAPTNAALAESRRLLQAMKKKEPGNNSIALLLRRLSTIPPSANVHWSSDLGKLLVIDLM